MSDSTQTLPLKSFERNVYSQGGEDGIIEEILARMRLAVPLDGWCVEFGAWDGIYLSNTYNLIKNQQYKGVLIEGDAERYKTLCKNIPMENVVKVRKFVSLEGDSTLDCVLRKTPIPKNFDFLSIDIDGCDYFIFESLTEYSPKVICIEFNPSIPNDVEYVQPKSFSVKRGSSPKSLVQLGEAKGYTLVAATDCNLFLVQYHLKCFVIGSGRVSLETIRDDTTVRSYIFYGFDGTILTSRTDLSLPWHRLRIDPRSIQPLPKFLRKFSQDYNRLEKVAFALFLAFKHPTDLGARLLRRLRKRSTKAVGQD
jgi:hypothetical protein